MSAWLPIASAPKDGTRVFLAYPGRAEPQVGRWVESTTTENGKVVRQSAYWVASDAFVFGKKCEPTHWMPFPAMPDIEVADATC